MDMARAVEYYTTDAEVTGMMGDVVEMAVKLSVSSYVSTMPIPAAEQQRLGLAVGSRLVMRSFVEVVPAVTTVNPAIGTTALAIDEGVVDALAPTPAEPERRCDDCGLPSGHRVGVRDYCCACYVAAGHPPADWHRGCMIADRQLKAAAKPPEPQRTGYKYGGLF